jgi:hypothetical protein
MDQAAAPPPPASTLLYHLPLPPLSEAAAGVVRRARAFLFGMGRGGFWARAVLQGYTESAHSCGVLYFGIVTAERSFGEWREWRALRPRRDPDLRESVDQLAAFRERWLERAREAVAVLADEDDREEVRYYLEEDDERPSRTWTAKAFVARLRGLQEMSKPVWQALVARGLVEELPAFERVLADVQGFIRAAPVDAAELAEIQAGREDAALALQKWLAERREELAPALGEADLCLLGLGDRVPPPFEGRSAFLLEEVAIAAKA